MFSKIFDKYRKEASDLNHSNYSHMPTWRKPILEAILRPKIVVSGEESMLHFPLANGAETSDLDKEDTVRRQWEGYKLKYNKQYSSGDEDNLRFELFKQRLRRINEHDAKSKGFQVGLNHMSDWTPEELNRLNGFYIDKNVKKVTPQEAGIL